MILNAFLPPLGVIFMANKSQINIYHRPDERAAAGYLKIRNYPYFIHKLTSPPLLRSMALLSVLISSTRSKTFKKI